MNNLELDRIQQLTDKQLIIFNAELQRRSRSVGVAYLLYLFFGYLGVHKFYLGKIGWGISYILLSTFGTIIGGLGALGFWAGIVTKQNNTTAYNLSIIGGIMLLIFAVLLFLDLFTIPRQVRKREEKIKETLLFEFEKERYLS